MDIPAFSIQTPTTNPAVKPQVISKSFQNVLNEGSSSSVVSNISSTPKPPDTQMSKIMSGLISGQGKLDKIIKLATSGKSFSPTELIAIQAGVYKFSQELELTSKVIEKATDGVKQTLQTQV